jgi:hypothetical protein
MSTRVGAGMAKTILERVRGYLGLLLMFMNYGFRGEYGKVRYCSYVMVRVRICMTPKGVAQRVGLAGGKLTVVVCIGTSTLSIVLARNVYI